MLNVPQTFRKFVVLFPSSVDGTQDEKYFDDVDVLFEFLNSLSVPYTVYSVYECLTWSTVKYDTNGKKSVVNKF